MQTQTEALIAKFRQLGTVPTYLEIEATLCRDSARLADQAERRRIVTLLANSVETISETDAQSMVDRALAATKDSASDSDHADPACDLPSAPLGSPLRPFPSIAFHGVFADYLRLLDGTIEYPAAFAWGAFASVLSFLLGRDAVLPWGPSSIVAVINTCLIGMTAKARKSTAHDDAKDIIADALRPRSSGNGEPDPSEIVVGSGSGEGFAEVVGDKKWKHEGLGKRKEDPGGARIQTHRRGLFQVHELGGLLEKMSRDQAGNMLDFILAAFDARKDWSHRTRTNPITITSGVGIFATASTEAWLIKSLTNSQVRAGLANRFIWLAGPRGGPIPRRPPIDVSRIEVFREKVRAALGAVRNQTFSLSSEADKLYAARYGLEYDHHSDSDITDAATARNDQLALRIAMLLAVAESTTLINARHIEAAWAVTEYSREVVDGLVQQVAAQNLKEAEDRVRRAIARVAVPSGNSFRRRDVRQRLKGDHGMDAETFNRVWDALLAAGDIEKAENSGSFREVGS